jgi:ATP-dependent RNA helicase DDX21
MHTIKENGPKKMQILLFSATVPFWVKQVAKECMAPDFELVDLAQNLKNKTSKTVNHLSINCPYHNRMSALADILVCYGGLG